MSGRGENQCTEEAAVPKVHGSVTVITADISPPPGTEQRMQRLTTEEEHTGSDGSHV